MLLFLFYFYKFIHLISPYNLKSLNKIYFHFYKINLFVTRKFKNISPLEKFILYFYQDKDFFEKSNFGIFNNEEVKAYGKKNHRLITFLHFYNMNFEFNFIDIFVLKNIYNLFKIKKNLNFINFLVFMYIYFDNYFNVLQKEYYGETDYPIYKQYYKFKKKKNENLYEELYDDNDYEYDSYYDYYTFFKINFLFIHFNIKNRRPFNKIYKNFNLKYYNDWYCYMFNKNVKKFFIHENILSAEDIRLRKKWCTDGMWWIKIFSDSYEYHFAEFEKDKKTKLFKVFESYKKITKQKSFYKLDYYIYDFFKNTKKYKLIFFKKIILKKNNLLFLLPTRFSETSLNKYINKYNISKYSFYYIRKNKIFNKSRYSRNRQLYRTGVYWCLWLNIMIVYGLYFIFYRFTFNFGYLWLGIGVLMFSFLFSRIIKYKFYNLYFLLNEFYNLYEWFGFIFYNFLKNFDIFFDKNNFFWNHYLISHFFNIYYIFYKYFMDALIFISKETDYGFVFLWESYQQTYGYPDESFYQWKSKIHWIGEFIKAVRY